MATAIVDYGLGNLGSIANMLKVIGEKVYITDDVQKICDADRLILPGVGAFDAGMINLHQIDLHRSKVRETYTGHMPRNAVIRKKQ